MNRTGTGIAVSADRHLPPARRRALFAAALCLATALIAPGAAPASPLTGDADRGPLKLNFNAAFWGIAGAPVQGRDGQDPYGSQSGFRHKTNLRFNPEYVTDTGFTIGARFDVGATNRYDSRFSRDSLSPPQGQNVPYIDKQYLYADTPYGQVTVGQVSGVGDRTAYYAPISNEVTGINSSSLSLTPELAPGFFDSNHFVGRPYTSTTNFANDSAKIMYFTPRIAGVQLGASYTPKPDAGGFARAAANLRFNALAGAPNPSAYLRSPQDNIGSAYEVGINYDRVLGTAGDLGPVEVRGSLTYGAARDPIGIGPREDTSAISLGLNVSLGDFTLGGSYGYIEGAVLGRSYDPADPYSGPALRGRGRERESFDLGGTYSINDWTLGMNYAYGTARYPVLSVSGAAARTPSTNGTEFSFDYAFAHGIDLISAVQFINFDAGTAAGERPANKTTTNLLVGTQIKF